MITARIATIEKPGHLVFSNEELGPAALAPGELLCETLVTAISPGTELAAYAGAPPLRPGVVYPRVVGYCNVAKVLHRGSSVAGIEVGDRVLTYSSHRSHFSIPEADVLAILPPSLSADDAVLAYLFHLGYNAVLKSDVRLGSSVVVIGLGVLGLGAVATAVMAGARVYCVSDQTAPQQRAMEFGAVACVSRDRLPELMASLGADRAQVVISTSNQWTDWKIALECAGRQGVIAVLGFPGRESPIPLFNPLDSSHFYSRQLRIIAAGESPELPDAQGFLPFNVRMNLKRILGWIESGSLKARLLVSGEFEGEEIARAYEALARREGSPHTYLLRWNGSIK